MDAGTTLNMSLDTAKAEGEDVVLPIGGIIKLISGTATVKLTGDFSDYESEVISKVLGALDVNTDVKNLKLDTTGVKFPEGLHYYPKLKNENGMLVFYAFRPRFHIILK